MRPYCVGLTGGAGAGKSAAAAIFSTFGVTVVDTDVISRELTSVGGAAMPAIVSVFGADFVDGTGAMNRTMMRSHVLSDNGARRQLEMILHPLIRAEAATRVLHAVSPYVVLVVPLLVEHLAEYRELVDRILVVDCDEAQQLRRIAARPSMDMDQARAILAVQSCHDARLAVADDVIDNRGGMEALAAQVAVLHARYLSAAQDKSTATANNSLQ